MISKTQPRIKRQSHPAKTLKAKTKPGPPRQDSPISPGPPNPLKTGLRSVPHEYLTMLPGPLAPLAIT